MFVDFGLDMPIASLSPSARTADPSLGVGCLLDIGIYTLTFASLILDQHPDNASGFYWEVDVVAIDVLEGRKESSVMPLAETLRVTRTMDAVRKTNGLVYPQDSK